MASRSADDGTPGARSIIKRVRESDQFRIDVLRELAMIGDAGTEITAELLREMADEYENAATGNAEVDIEGVNNQIQTPHDTVIAAAAIADISAHTKVVHAYLNQEKYDAVLWQLDFIRARCSWIETIVRRRVTAREGTA